MAKTKKSDADKKAKAERKAALVVMGEPEPYLDEENPKHKKKIKRNNVGRPTVITKQVVAKLEQAFRIRATKEEACTYAGIYRTTLYRHIQENPDFATQIEEWMDHPILAARANIIGAVTHIKSIPDSWTLLRSAHKDEFAEQKNHKVDISSVSIDDLNAAAAAGIVAEEEGA